MAHVDLPKFPTKQGYMTEKIQRDYIQAVMAKDLLPAQAHRMADILSLTAPSDVSKPIQFWQLYSVLGQDPIVAIVQSFYQRVFEQDEWFRSVFERVGGTNHHINTQASMWIDVMGGGPYYHGAEFRLNFHHTHNAMPLMNDKGAELWSKLMLETLDASMHLMADDPRIRTSINTFLSFFMGKYADEFAFENRSFFGATNPPYKRKINFMKMTEQAIEALSEAELAEALSQQGVDLTQYEGKAAKVNKALMM
ncbi:globin domain-containing protein [Yoonia sp. MH D7]